MQFCQPHWDALKSAITDKGMSLLVPNSSEEACNRMMRQTQGRTLAETFDPLMSAHNMIVIQSMDYLGMGVMGDCCPLCEMNKIIDGTDKTWIEGCTDEVLQFCREHQLVPQIQ